MSKKLSVFMVLAIVISLFAGCSKGAATSSAPSTIKLGLDYELSGAVAVYG